MCASEIRGVMLGAIVAAMGTPTRCPISGADGLVMVQTDAKRLGLAPQGAKVGQSVVDDIVAASTRGRVKLVSTPAVRLGEGLELRVRSVVHVPKPGKPSIAIVSDFDGAVWDATYNTSFECVFDNGYTSDVHMYGHETQAAYPPVIVWTCHVPPDDDAPGVCHAARLQPQGGDPSTESVEACDDDRTTTEADGSHDLAACVPIPYEDPENMAQSGFVQLPQWLEYNTMHGVGHFLAYLLADNPEHRNRTLTIMQPFLEAGLASVVEVEGFGDPADWVHYHSILANDCMYRMKGRTRWLMATVDLDEYLHIPDHPDITEGLDEIGDHCETPLSAVSFRRYQYVLPEEARTLQLTSVDREDHFAPLCPKYILRPEQVHALFIHWPTSMEAGFENVFASDVWAAHYRLTNERVKSDNLTMERDDTLEGEAATLERRLLARYGEGGIESLAAKSVPTALPELWRGRLPMDEYDDEVSRGAQFWVRSLLQAASTQKWIQLVPPSNL
mmetsp:Transcript_84177/g.234714  ORF Transcript_84177/g.234714 Transcript_84177/m.234714 type:complete len:502 (-) Transcript_84177:95-1600(-)